MKPDPVERITIDEIMNHKWIIYYNKNPITPLRTTEKFKENSNLLELSVRILNDALSSYMAFRTVWNMHLLQCDLMFLM